MLGLSWPETCVIVIIGLMVLGPKELAMLIRKARQYWAAFQNLGSELSSHLDTFIEESGVNEVKKELSQQEKDIRHSMHKVVDLEGKEQEAYDVSVLKDLTRRPPSP